MGLPSGISAFPERVQYQFDGIKSTKRDGPTSPGNLKNLRFEQGDFSREWQYFRVFAASAPCSRFGNEPHSISFVMPKPKPVDGSRTHRLGPSAERAASRSITRMGGYEVECGARMSSI
jgi:hypothetical protein